MRDLWDVTLVAESRPVVSGLRNRFQSELELVRFSQKSGDSIVEHSRANYRPDVGRESHVGLHCRFPIFVTVM